MQNKSLKYSQSTSQLQNASLFNLPSIQSKRFQNKSPSLLDFTDMKSYESTNLNKSKMKDYKAQSPAKKVIYSQLFPKPEQSSFNPPDMKLPREFLNSQKADMQEPQSMWTLRVQRSQQNLILKPLQNQQYTKYKHFQMALKNENKVNKPLYVQDSSKIYGKVDEEEKIRKLLIDMKEQQKQLQNQVNSQITSRQQNGRVPNVYDRLSKQINVVKTSRNIGDQSSIQLRKLDDSTMQMNLMMNDLSKLNPTNEKLNMNYQSLETSSLDYSQLKPQNHNVSQLTLKDISHLALQQDDSNILRLKREMIVQAVKQYSTKPQKQALSNLQSPDNQSTLFNSQNQIKHFNKLKEIKMNLKHVINISARQSNQLSQIQDSSLLGANKQTSQNNSSVMANQQSQILPNQLQTEAYHKINEYLEHLKTQQETSEQPNIKIVEIIKAFMHEMIQAYTEESIKTEKSMMQQQIEQNIELLKGLFNSPRKMSFIFQINFFQNEKEVT